MKSLVKQLTPKFLLNLYHGLVSFGAAWRYGFPSRNLIVIGVTGTNGKSTTVNIIASILKEAGFKVALASTVNFQIGDQEWLNNLKMTMPGRGYLQKFLKQALDEGCTYAIIETSSEGLAQNRHWGLYYDAAVFTNLTPEHIESHGSFANYQKAKLALFKSLERSWRKTINGRQIPTVIVANSDDAHAPFYLQPQADLKATYGLNATTLPYTHFQAEEVSVSLSGLRYRVVDNWYQSGLKGTFDVYNTLAAVATAEMLDIGIEAIESGLAKMEGVPGRLELIQKEPFMVLVDYAPEPGSLSQLFNTLKAWHLPEGRIIHILGSTGGGRDVARRPILGELAANNANIVIVTNEDPYDDDPQKIIDDVAYGSAAGGKIAGQDLFKILDRREAIAKALNLARPGDLVLVTGKGSEQKMAVANGQYIDWDDRQVIREELKKLGV